VSQRFDRQQMIERIRANHRDPRNLAMHVVGSWFVFRAVKRLFAGRFLRAVLNGGIGAALLVGGHQLEGSDAFSIFKQGGGPREATYGNGRLAAKI
jgi:hypothetical protein